MITSKQVIQALKRFGFVEHRQKGSHMFMQSKTTPMRVVCVPVHSKDIKKGTLKAILKQAGLDTEKFTELL